MNILSKLKSFLVFINLILVLSNLSIVPAQTFTKITTGPIVTDGGNSWGCSWGDYNGDGFLDLFIANRDQNNFLYLNNGNDTFTKITEGEIVTDGGNSMCGCWLDFDEDSNLDLFVANSQFQNNALYLNNGDGSFTKITGGIIVDDDGSSTSASWADYDNDSDLDLFVSNSSSANDYFYENNGDGTFTKLTNSIIVGNYPMTRGSIWGDYDNDGDPDLFIAKDGNNLLFRNNGDKTFYQITNDVVVNDGGTSNGGSWGDYNNDGFLDLFVANAYGEDNFLYFNNGDGSFIKIFTGDIVNNGGSSISSSWGDMDNDGDLDLFVANFDNENNFLYSNNGDGTFTRITSGSIVNDGGDSRCCSWGDYDSDGDLDLIVTNSSDQNNFLYQNNGNTNNWLQIRCIGTTSNMTAFGARIRCKAVINGTNVLQTREIESHTGHLSENSLEVEFGLGNANMIDSILVIWPTFDTTQVFTQVSANQKLTIYEPLQVLLVSVNPKIAYQNLFVDLLTTGRNTHFSDGNGTSAIRLEKGSSSIYANNFNVLSNTSLEAEFFIPASADTGKWDLLVETDLDDVLTMEEAITVYPEPAVAVVSPNFTNPVVIQLNDSVDLNISIGNSGGDTLEWTARVARAPVSPLEKHAARNINGKKPTGGEEAPVLRENESVLFPAPWDLQFGYSLPSLGNAGSEFDGEYFYITKWASNYIDKYDVNGNFIEEFSIPGVSGLRDLAFDGTYMYGGTAGNTIYQMDFTTQALVGTISSPVIVRHIAYDERYDAFWVGNWSTDIVLVDRSGITLNTIPSYGHGLVGIYGSAYDKWSDGGPYLWVFDQGMGPGTPQYIYQIDLNTGMLTGFAYDVSVDFPQSFGIAGGLFAREGIVPDKATIGGVLQGTPDILFGYELADVGLSWISLLTESGIVEPGGQSDLTFRVYGTEEDGDIAYVVIYTNDPMAPVVNVEVIRDVVVGISQSGNVPTVFDVKQNYPNPFNPITIIKYQLPRTSEVELQIFNILGQKVTTLVKGRVQPGYYEAIWNGRNDLGQQVSSGIYIYRFKAADYQKTLKLILLK